MKSPRILLARTLLLPLLASSTFGQVIPHLFESDGSGPPNKLYWQTEPGHRYDLWESSSLNGWSRVAGFPKVAEGLAMEHAFTPEPGGKGFFKIEPIDEQPPVVTGQYPTVDGFAVGRFSDLAIELEDATGIDPTSVLFTIGGTGPLGPGSPGLTISGNTITYDSGDSALGAWGETVTATLVAADPPGNTLTHTWNFRLEPEPIVAENVFVFGSPTAQRAGQRVGATPTAALAARFPATGPVKANDPPEWSIDEVLADRLVIAYGEGGPPVFTADQLLCNLTPVTADEVFYRKALSTTDDAANQRLTLFTEDVPLEQFIQQGAVSLSPDSIVYKVDGDGTLVRASELTGSFRLAPIGPDLSGEVLWSSGGASLQLNEARWQITPEMRVAVEMEDSKLQRFEAGLDGGIRAALVPALQYSGSASFSSSKSLANARRFVISSVGGIPIWLDMKFDLSAEFSANASIEAELSGGARQNLNFGFGGRYERGESPAVTWTRKTGDAPLQIVPFSYTIDGSAGAEVKLTPKIDLRVYSLAGVTANVDPRFGVTGEAEMVNGELESAEWDLYARADLNLGLSVLGVDDGDLPSYSYNLYSRNWAIMYPEELQIRKHPQSASVKEDGSVMLEVVAVGPGEPEDLHYQWYHNGLPIPGRTGSHLSLVNVNQNKTGSYFVKVSAEGETVESEVAVVVSPATEFVLIPAGEFQMGDSLGDSGEWGDGPDNPENPVHTVHLRAYHMARHEVTKALWDVVRVWGLNNGYTDLPAGLGKTANHPVHSITWYDMVKWCNARSEMNNLPPCYTISGTPYRTGYSDSVVCHWDSTGYRLPTEAEWEKAARGGLTGKRFPWGDIIKHALANYYVVSYDGTTNLYSYDVSPTRVYHPTYDNGPSPFTSPVGSFAPNGYGLYDMAGNIGEWCWDWYSKSYYSSSPNQAPRGPTSGLKRATRGGAYDSGADDCRVANRGSNAPDDPDGDLGFRLVRSTLPQCFMNSRAWGRGSAR